MTGGHPTEDGERRGRDSQGQPNPPGLAQQLSDLARSLQAEPDLDQTLEGVVVAAVENIAGADYAGITRIDRNGRVGTPAATDEIVPRIDQAQYETDEGPCLDAIRHDATIRSDDLRTDERWPRFAARALELGVTSMLSFQLFVRDRELGALNLYSRDANVFDESTEQIGLLLASHAAVAMVGAESQHNLLAAVRHREVIGRATGILMERHKMTGDQAFALLIRTSSVTHRKVRDIAEELTMTGELSTRRPRPPAAGRGNGNGNG